MKSMLLSLAPTLLVLCSCATEAPATHRPEDDWQTYMNGKHGYELRYPQGFDLRLTGANGERDGASVRIAFKDYAAPAPVLDIQIAPRTPEAQFPTLGTRVPGMTVRLDDIQINGLPARQAQYCWTTDGDLAFAEVYLQGVLFRFEAASGVRDLRDENPWWAIIATFRFHDG